MTRPRFSFVSLLKVLRPAEFIRLPFMFSYILLFTSYLLVLVFFFRLPPVVPLFYSLAQPAQHLAAKEWLFMVPLIITLITLTHISLIHAFKEYEKLLLQLFSWTTMIINLLFFAALLRILIIVS